MKRVILDSAGKKGLARRFAPLAAALGREGRGWLRIRKFPIAMALSLFPRGMSRRGTGNPGNPHPDEAR